MGPSGAKRADGMIGSVETHHDSEERTNELLPYLHELLEAGPGWALGPAEPASFGRSARRKKPATPGARALRSGMWTAGPSLPGTRPGSGRPLPSCQERQLAALEVDEGETGGGQGG